MVRRPRITAVAGEARRRDTSAGRVPRLPDFPWFEPDTRYTAHGRRAGRLPEWPRGRRFLPGLFPRAGPARKANADWGRYPDSFAVAAAAGPAWCPPGQAGTPVRNSDEDTEGRRTRRDGGNGASAPIPCGSGRTASHNTDVPSARLFRRPWKSRGLLPGATRREKRKYRAPGQAKGRSAEKSGAIRCGDKGVA